MPTIEIKDASGKKAGTADLAASVTIGVGDFLTLVEKAGA